MSDLREAVARALAKRFGCSPFFCEEAADDAIRIVVEACAEEVRAATKKYDTGYKGDNMAIRYAYRGCGEFVEAAIRKLGAQP